MKVCVSLEELFKNGKTQLYYGGRIVKTEDGGNIYYDLRKDFSDTVLLEDGEQVDFDKREDPIEKHSFWYGISDDGKAVYFTEDEYAIGVFQ